MAIIKNPLAKKSKRAQAYDMATADGRVLPAIEIEVQSRCADDTNTGRSFLIDEGNQYLNENNVWIQVAGESSALPMMTRIKREIDENEAIDQIYRDTKEEEKQGQFLNRLKMNTLDKLLWIIGIPTVGLMLMYAINKLTGG